MAAVETLNGPRRRFNVSATAAGYYEAGLELGRYVKQYGHDAHILKDPALLD